MQSVWWMDATPLDGAFHALLLIEACALSAVGHRSHLQSIMDANVFLVTLEEKEGATTSFHHVERARTRRRTM